MVRKFEIKPIKINDKNVCYNFFVDGIGLDKILGVDRLSDMRFSNFDFDVFEVEKTKFPQYNRLEIIKRAIDIYTGIEKPFNQFGTDRVVLYRC